MRTHALKHLARLRYGGALTTEERVETGEVPVFGSGGVHGRHDRANTAGPVIVVGRKGSVGALHWSGNPVWVADTAYAVDQLLRSGSMRYVYYLLHASRLAELSQDVGVPGLSRDAVHGLPCPAWSCERQREIASCLDRECARIERVAAAQAKLAALGTDAITSACAATFSGGTAAILGGDDGVRLRFLVREVDERAETRGLPLLSVTIDRGVVRRDQLTDDLPRAVDLSNYKSVAARDIVVNRMRAFQGAVGVAPEDGIVSPDYLVLRVRSDNDPSLVARALASQRGADVMASLIRGIGGVENGAVRTPRINTNDLLDVRLRVPPAAEQAQIVAALEQAERDSQTLGGIARAVGDALARYRDSLIHEAVTGKLDVTAASDRQMDERLHAAAENRLDEVAV